MKKNFGGKSAPRPRRESSTETGSRRGGFTKRPTKTHQDGDAPRRPALSRRALKPNEDHQEERRPVFSKRALGVAEGNSFARALSARLFDDLRKLKMNRAEPFSELDYDIERNAKAREFEQWWKSAGFDGKILPFVAAPLPRAYRGTTKRSVHLTREGLVLDIGDQLEILHSQRGLYTVVPSNIEPASHFEVYCLLAEKLSTPPYFLLAEMLNYIIIRDTGEMAVIFNVAELSGEIIRKCKALAKLLEESELPIASAWVYHDASRSEYYLDTKESDDTSLRYKKLFGFDSLKLELSGVRFRVSPFSFSQVNFPMMKELVKIAAQNLPTDKSLRLLDLYCGYGLFSHSLAALCAETVGLDSAEDSITEASELVRRRKKLGHAIGKMSFRKCFITAPNLKKNLPAPGGASEVVILDPPRQGTAEAVIEVIAARKPDLVMHIFCSIDEIARSLKEWQRSGYRVVSTRAFDMFPGTTSIEVMVVLSPKR